MNTTPPGAAARPTRDFTVATFVVHNKRVLLLWHRKIRMWLPPGGHIEADELPDEAAIREVMEETGILVELLGDPGLPIDSPRQLVRPFGIQLEDIQPGHQHVDIIYFARPCEGAPTEAVGNDESEAVRWFTLDEMPAGGVVEEVRLWARRAVQEVGARRSLTSRPRAR